MSPSNATPRKFTFDLDMGATRVNQRIIKETDLQALLSEAEARGYQRGLAEGEQTSTAQSARQLTDSVSALVAKSQQAVTAAEAMHAEKVKDAVKLSVTVASKLAGHMMARFPLDDVRALLRECLASLDNAPHLVIRCAPQVADAIQKLAEKEIASSGFSGRLVVMGEPEMGIGDTRFEWVDGGIKREFTEISAEINTRIKAFLTGETAQETTT